MERIRIQQSRLDKVSTALESIRNEIRELERQDSSLETRLRELTESLDKAPSAARTEVENEVRVTKQAISFQKERQDELRQKETQLSENLRDEQTKLDELEKKLTTLEADLERGIERRKPN